MSEVLKRYVEKEVFDKIEWKITVTATVEGVEYIQGEIFHEGNLKFIMIDKRSFLGMHIEKIMSTIKTRILVKKNIIVF